MPTKNNICPCCDQPWANCAAFEMDVDGLCPEPKFPEPGARVELVIVNTFTAGGATWHDIQARRVE